MPSAVFRSGPTWAWRSATPNAFATKVCCTSRGCSPAASRADSATFAAASRTVSRIFPNRLVAAPTTHVSRIGGSVPPGSPEERLTPSSGETALGIGLGGREPEDLPEPFEDPARLGRIGALDQH